MTQQDTIAVIGAGIIGSAVALGLAREGRLVLLLDRAAPAVEGASFGNVGHIARNWCNHCLRPGCCSAFGVS